MEYKEMSLWDSIKYILPRTVNVLNKLLGMKGVVLFSTIYLFQKDIIPEQAVGYVWIFIVLIVVFGEKALTFIKDIKK